MDLTSIANLSVSEATFVSNAALFFNNCASLAFVVCNCSSTLINFSNFKLISLIVPSFSFNDPSNATFLLDSFSKLSFNLFTLASNVFFSFVNDASLPFVFSNANSTSFSLSNCFSISPINASLVFKLLSNCAFIFDSVSNSCANRSRCFCSCNFASSAFLALSSALIMDS